MLARSTAESIALGADPDPEDGVITAHASADAAVAGASADATDMHHPALREWARGGARGQALDGPWGPWAAAGGADRPALFLLAGWLLLTAAPVVAGTRAAIGVAAWFGVARHLALLAAAVAALGASRAAGRLARAAGPGASRARVVALVLLGAFAAWLPLVAVPALYAELPLVAAGVAGVSTFAPMHDALVVRWELAVFGPLLGGSPATVLARAAPWTPLSELLHLAYLAYYVIIYVPPALLWWEATRRRRAGEGGAGLVSGAAAPRRAYDASACTVLLAFVLCYAVFVLFPVQGPWYTWATGGPNGLPLTGWVRAFVQGLLVAGSSRGTAFPSSHVAVSVAQTVALARVAPRVAWVVGPATALLALGAVYGGYHYGVDAVAGAVVGAVAGWAGPRLTAWVAQRP